MIIVTSGYPYIDIDAYAGCIAYAELLNLMGQPSRAVSSAPLNESITAEVLSWQAPLETSYIPSNQDYYVMIDLSDPKFFEKFATPERVSEVIDHHPGFESYWREKLGDKAQIETIGSVATIIFERWQAAGLVAKMSRTSARLLLTAILDNTLNFGAAVTHERDNVAYQALLGPAGLPTDWAKRYFNDMQQVILADLPSALANDTKHLAFKTFPEKVTIGQLVVWDGQKILDSQKELIKTSLAHHSDSWFLNLVSIVDKQSFFVCSDHRVQAWLGNLLGVGSFKKGIAIANRLWLRKEIIKQDLIKFDK